GADDRLQHVHRGRGPRREDRPRRHDLRLSGGPPARPQGGGLGAGARRLPEQYHGPRRHRRRSDQGSGAAAAPPRPCGPERPHAPKGAAWERALDDWRSITTDPDATFDEVTRVSAPSLIPHVSWGTNPGQTVAVSDVVPSPDHFDDPLERDSAARALEYMDLRPGTPITDIP